jgi:hypothetical protein
MHPSPNNLLGRVQDHHSSISLKELISKVFRLIKHVPTQITAKVHQVVCFMALKQYTTAIQVCGDIMNEFHPLAHVPSSQQDPESDAFTPWYLSASARNEGTMTKGINCNPFSAVSLHFYQEGDKTAEEGFNALHRHANNVINTDYQVCLVLPVRPCI